MCHVGSADIRYESAALCSGVVDTSLHATSKSFEGHIGLMVSFLKYISGCVLHHSFSRE